MYREIARLYAELKKSEESVNYLRLAKEQAILWDENYNSDAEYTCLIFRNMKHGGVHHNSIDNDSLRQIDAMKEPVFDFIRTEPEFEAIMKELEEHAGKH